MKKLYLGGLILALTISLVGCGTTASKPQAFNAQQEQSFVTQFSDLVGKKSEPQVLIDTLNKDNAIGKLNQKDATNVVDQLLYDTGQFEQSMLTESQGFQPQFTDAQKKGIDLTNPQNYDKVTDSTFKAFLQQVKARHFIVINNEGVYEVHPDIQWIIDQYGKYVSPDVQALMNFTASEYKTQFYHRNSNTFDLNLVAERIIAVEKMMGKYPKSDFLNGMKQIRQYYYQIYFGQNSSFLVDENKKVLPNVIQNYNDTLKKYPDSELANHVKDYLAQLNKTNDVVTDNVAVWVLSMTNAEGVQQPTQNTQSQANTQNGAISQNNSSTQPSNKASDSQQMNALNQAIKQNSK